MIRIKVKSGDRFGRLTVIKELDKIDNKRKCLCLCDCGKTKEIRIYGLTSGAVVSCGCYHSERTKFINFNHGLYRTRLHSIWENMKQRCYNSNYKRFKNYGAKGIIICGEWHDFKNFYDWSLSHGYEENLTLDRKDNNGIYSPDNCRWISNRDQQLNKSTNRLITFNGETKTLTEWAKQTGMTFNMLQYRINNWSLIEAFDTPRLKKGFRHNILRK